MYADPPPPRPNRCTATTRKDTLVVRCDLDVHPEHDDHEHWASGPSVLAGILWAGSA